MTRETWEILRDNLLITLVGDAGGSLVVTLAELNRAQSKLLLVRQLSDGAFLFEIKVKQ